MNLGKTDKEGGTREERVRSLGFILSASKGSKEMKRGGTKSALVLKTSTQAAKWRMDCVEGAGVKAESTEEASAHTPGEGDCGLDEWRCGDRCE